MEDLSAIAAFANAIKPKFESDRFESIELPGSPSPEPKPKKDVPKFLDKERCNDCGLCAASCPVGAIDRQTGDIDSDKCINCMRCTFVCPAKARSFHADATRTWLEENFSEPRKIEWFL